MQKKNVMDGGINISELLEITTIPQMEKLDKTIEEQNMELFETEYTNLINTCNSCHKTAKYEFVVIEHPKTPALDNQDYNFKN